jgi:hypothetical protein
LISAEPAFYGGSAMDLCSGDTRVYSSFASSLIFSVLADGFCDNNEMFTIISNGNLILLVALENLDISVFSFFRRYFTVRLPSSF